MDIRGAVLDVTTTENVSVNMSLNQFDAGIYMLQIESGNAQKTMRVVLQ